MSLIRQESKREYVPDLQYSEQHNFSNLTFCTAENKLWEMRCEWAWLTHGATGWPLSCHSASPMHLFRASNYVFRTGQNDKCGRKEGKQVFISSLLKVPLMFLLCSLPFPSLSTGRRFSLSASFESCPAGLAGLHWATWGCLRGCTLAYSSAADQSLGTSKDTSSVVDSLLLNAS